MYATQLPSSYIGYVMLSRFIKSTTAYFFDPFAASLLQDLSLRNALEFSLR